MTPELVRFTSAMAALVAGVTEYFAYTMGDTAPAVKFGFLERGKQAQGPGRANRIVFLPADLSGNAGKLAAPRDVGRQTVSEDNAPTAEVRPLLSWERVFAMSVWAYDGSAARDELVQFAAVEALLEKAAQALEQVHGAGGPNVAWGGVTAVVTKENTFGAELLVSLQLIHPLMDAPVEIGTPGFTLTRVGADTEEE